MNRKLAFLAFSIILPVGLIFHRVDISAIFRVGLTVGTKARLFEIIGLHFSFRPLAGSREIIRLTCGASGAPS